MNGAIRMSASAQVGGARIYCDCASVIKMIKHPHRLRKFVNKPIVGPLNAAARGIASSKPVIAHVKAHTGDSIPEEEWSSTVLGNHLADRVAAGDTGELTKYNINIIDIPYTALLADMAESTDWYLQHEGRMMTENPFDVIDAQRKTAYFTNRDELRAARSRNAVWFTSSTIFSAFIFNRGGKSVANRAVGQRLGLDKGWHGGNRSKGITDEELRRAAVKCELCNDDDSLAHILRHCLCGNLHSTRSEIERTLNAYVFKSRELSKHERELAWAIRK